MYKVFVNEGDGEEEILHMKVDSAIEASIFLKKTDHFLKRSMNTEIECFEGEVKLIEYESGKYFRIVEV